MKRIMLMVCCLGVSTVYAAEAEAPSMELLEFMGEWEGSDGQWQDPMQLVDVDDADFTPSDQQSQLQQTGNGTMPMSEVNEEVKHDEK